MTITPEERKQLRNFAKDYKDDYFVRLLDALEQAEAERDVLAEHCAQKCTACPVACPVTRLSSGCANDLKLWAKQQVEGAEKSAEHVT